MCTEWGAIVDTFERNNGSKNENKRQKESEDENGVEKCAIRDVASCDLDLHQVNESIAARYRYTSHARWEVKLHRCCKTLETPQFPPKFSLTDLNNVPTIRSTPIPRSKLRFSDWTYRLRSFRRPMHWISEIHGTRVLYMHLCVYIYIYTNWIGRSNQWILRVSSVLRWWLFLSPCIVRVNVERERKCGERQRGGVLLIPCVLFLFPYVQNWFWLADGPDL